MGLRSKSQLRASDLECVREIRQSLDKLAAAGAHRSMVLNMLADVVRQAQPRRLTHDRKWQKRTLKSLAERIRRMADEIERFYSGMADRIVRTYPDSGLKEVHRAHIHPDLRIAAQLQLNTLAFRPILDGMRACASDLEEKAVMMGRIAKLSEPSKKRALPALLLSYLQGTTGNARNHLGTVCEMLNAAYYEYAVKQTVTTDSLEKLLRRHVLPRPR